MPPYIKQEERETIRLRMENAGHLQYIIATLVEDYVRRTGLNYQTCNNVMGALTGAQLEFYRRVVAPYEDKKIKDNGDVFPQ